MTTAVERLLEILDLENLEINLYRGRSPQSGWQRVFGGQVIGQALVAAMRTVDEDRHIHSLHSYFMRPGDPSVPIIYEVDRIHDGRSFTTRRVVAIQHGKAIFSLSASFQVFEDGLEHQFEMPDVPAPETLMSDEDMKNTFLHLAPEPVKKYFERERPIELKPLSFKHYVSREKLPPEQKIWFRANNPLPDDQNIHRCVLAYASDMTLLDTSLYAHGRAVFDRDLQVASLDHSMWFHRPVKADEWLLYVQDSPNTSGARGLTRGLIHSRDGALVATVMQEGLIRLRSEKS